MSDQEEEDEGPRFPPPSQEQVAYRALCLYVVIGRGFYELDMRLSRQIGDNKGIREAQRRMPAINRWLDEQRVRPHLSPSERELLAKPLGSWTDQEIADASWRTESLGMLLWALSEEKSIPPYDTQIPDSIHIRHFGKLAPVAGFLARVKLRPAKEIAHARDGAELWHWRARTRQVQEDGSWSPSELPEQFNTFEKIIATAAQGAYEDGWSGKPIKGDFPVLGKPYAQLTEDEYSEVQSIAMERHFALNWLCGYSQDWDNTPTDT